MNRGWVIFCATVAIFAAWNSMAWATNGLDSTAFSARSAGMGGVDLAIANDATAINTNPAGLTLLSGHRLDIGSALMVPSVHFTNGLNDEDGEAQPFVLPSMAYAWHPEKLPIAFGGGIFTQGGMGSHYELTHRLLGDGQEYSSQLAYFKASLAVAYQPVEMVSVGLSLSGTYAMLGMRMPYSMPTGMMGGVVDPTTGMTFGDMFGAPPQQGGLGYDELTAASELRDASATGIGATLGVLVHPHDDLSVGLTYTPKSKMTFEGTMAMEMNAQYNDAFGRMVQGAMQQMPELTQAQASGAVAQQLMAMGIDPNKGMGAEYDAEIEFAWPQKVGLGVAYKPIPKLELAIDAEWINWAATMDRMAMNLTGGTNDNINRMVGSSNIAAGLPLQWDDQVVVAFGSQFEVAEGVTLRLGYRYGNNPVPAQTVIPIFPALVENHVSAGVGYRYSEYQLDFAFEHALNTALEGSSDHLVAHEYEGSESSLALTTGFLTLSADL